MKKISSLILSGRLQMALVLAIVIAMLGAGLSFNPSKASTIITVNTTLDGLGNDGFCTLREAVISANTDTASGNKVGECPAGSGTDTIILPNNLPSGSVFALTKNDSGKEDSPSAGDLDITSNMTIQAGGPGVVLMGASGFNSRLVQVISGTAKLTGFTISGGNTPNNGGAISNQGTLTLSNMTLTNNKAVLSGGAIYNASTGNLTISNTTIYSNTTSAAGGGIYNDGGTLKVTNSTLSANSANLDGGGLYSGGAANLNNVTITLNKADSDKNGTGDGGGIFRSAGSLTLSNTIVAGNIDASSAAQAPDCAGAVNSLGYNLIQNTAGCTLSGTLTGNITGMSAALGPLQNNGGPTLTHALLTGSPAIDAGSPAAPGSGSGACETTDQRGRLRPRGAACDIGAFETGLPNAPVIIRAFPNTAANTTTVQGRLFDAPGATYTLNYYSGANCTGLVSGTPLSTSSITTDNSGNFYFSVDIPAVPNGQYMAVTATDPSGDTSSASACILVGPGNDSWPHATPLTLQPNGTLYSASLDQYVDTLGQSRWFKFTVQPGSQLIVTLTNLPANYDLTLYKDIQAAYQALTSTQDLVRMGAESAPSAFTPSAFTPSAFTPSAFTAVSQDLFSAAAFSPSAFTPSAFTPSAFTPSAFTPSAFTPSAFTAAAISPDALTPSAFTPSAFTPSAFTPSAFTPSAFTPSILDPAAFGSAQTRSLIGVSAFDGTAPEGLILNTWNNTGTFYIRVRGREGAFSLASPFHLQVLQLPGNCGNLDTTFATYPYSTVATAGNFKTVILTDFGRMKSVNGDSDADLTTLREKLNTFAARPEVAGVIVDVGLDNQVSFANSQADTNYGCPFAKNLVAQSIKGIVDSYRALNPQTLQYVVIVGNDSVIPFFRYPDQSLLGSEDNYVPPVKDDSASQASLRLNYVLSQDAYGSKVNISMLSNVFPIPGLPVGRLVETAAEATNMINVYMSGNPAGGDVVVTPSTAMVTGYDFLSDAAAAVSSELKAGLGPNGTVDATLIAPQNLSPQDPASWTADQLRQHLLGARHDITFLAGHFSAVSAEAADYKTYMLSTDLLASPVDMKNSIIFSAGCHSGYNIVNKDNISGVTFEPDWAQVFARKGATLIAGTGYQYGDTDFIQYSERLYLDFSQQLRTGAAGQAVSVGNALVAAKQMYMSSTPQLRGIHEKAVLESTLFGLPMLKVNMPGARLPAGNGASVVPSTSGFNTNPGAALGLRYADVSVLPNLTQNNPVLTNLDGGTVTAVYFSDQTGGVLSNPLEPVLPLNLSNVTAPPLSGQPPLVLRGVGFRGGVYSDLSNVLPLVGAATTELRGVHTPFLSDVFFPVQPWDVNYYGALADATNGATRLVVTPGQYRSSLPGSSVGTLRTYNQMNFRLFYSNYLGSGSTTPAQAAAPTIVRVLSAVPGNGTVTFNVSVTGDPAAGIQQVWVTWTDTSNPAGGVWQSLDLAQNAMDSTLWQGTLPLGSLSAPNIRFIVQACNGVGLCNEASNLGAYYIPGVLAAPSKPTSLTLNPPPPASGLYGTGTYGSQATFSALLTDPATNTPLANQRIIFNLGAQGRQVQTNASGVASATFPLLSIAGQYNLSAFFPGSGDYQVSSAAATFAIAKQATHLALSLPTASILPGQDTKVVATLTDAAGNTMSEKNVCFIVGTLGRCQITDYLGQVFLGSTSLPKGVYTVNAYFSGSIPLPGGTINLNDDRYSSTTSSGSLTINTPPVAANDSYSTLEGNALTVPAPGVLGNDTDADHDPLTAVLVSGPANGTLALNANGSFTYTPNATYFGSDSFTYQAFDGTDKSSLATVSINVLFVNHAPSFTKGVDQSVLEDAPAQTVPGWATNISAGPANESSQTLSFQVTNSNNALFSVQPAIASNGTLTYTPAPNMNGSAVVTVALKDSGGTANGGVDTSPAQTFNITVQFVNDAPSFTKGPDQFVMVNGAAQTVAGWATNLSPGPGANEVGQALNFVVTNNNNPLFSTQPAIDSNGNLTYAPAPNMAGSATVTVQLHDNGGTANGGVDTSPAQTFTITVFDASQISVTVPIIWSPNGTPVQETVTGVPAGLTFAFESVIPPTAAHQIASPVWQDEVVGSIPDAAITGTYTFWINGLRDGSGNGRAYHVYFVITDGHGFVYHGQIKIDVPHDQGPIDTTIDGGSIYPSIVPGP